LFTAAAAAAVTAIVLNKELSSHRGTARRAIDIAGRLGRYLIDSFTTVQKLKYFEKACSRPNGLDHTNNHNNSGKIRMPGRPNRPNLTGSEMQKVG